MTPRTDSQAARHTGGWIVLGGLFILACMIFQLPQSPRSNQSADTSIQLGIDINRAGIAELSCIPGVGEGLAARIVAYRETHGPFQSLSELQQVPGVGPAKAAQLTDALLPLPEHPTTRIVAAPLPPIGSSTGNMHD